MAAHVMSHQKESKRVCDTVSHAMLTVCMHVLNLSDSA